MTDKEIREYLEDNLEVRPFDKDGKEDGNWLYIHRTKVAELIHRIRRSES